MSLIDDIRKALQGEKKSEFLGQILKEKALYDALREAGLTVVAEDAQARALQRPFGVLSKVQKIDLVDLITEITTIKTLEVLAEITNIQNLESLDLIDRIALIDSITNIDTLANITNIANLQSVDLIDTITNVGTLNLLNTIGQINKINPQGANNVVIDLVSNITNLGTLNLLNTVNLIKSISSIDSITLLGTVGNIQNVQNIQSIDLIDAITNLGNIDNITNIKKIGNIKNASVTSDLIKNGGFETGDFSEWKTIGTVAITTDADEGTYAAKITGASYLYQHISPVYGDGLVLACRGKSSVDAVYVNFLAMFTDLTFETIVVAFDAAPYKYKSVTFTTHKPVLWVGFQGSTAGVDYYIDQVRASKLNIDVHLYAWDGSAWQKVRCDANGYLITTTPP